MQIDVDMSYEQYFEASRLCFLKASRKNRWTFLFIWYAAPILGCALALFAGWQWLSTRTLTGMIWLNLMFAAILLWSRFKFPSSIRKRYEKQTGSLAGRLTLTPAGVRFERKDAAADSNWTWGAFERWLERPDMFLVFPNLDSFMRIPKDKLTGTEQDEVRGWISAASKHID